MKKIRFFALVLALLIVCSFSCFATTYKDNLKTSLDLEGFVAVYHIVTITELSETGSLGYGTPFDITGDDVKYNTTDENLGRRIATWDFSSTSGSVTITIKASPMTCDTNASKSLDYIISFKYKYATFDENGNYKDDVSGYIKTNSTDSDGESIPLENGTKDQSFPIIASSQQDIRFMFMNGVDPSNDYYPTGFYTATVTVIFTEGV